MNIQILSAAEDDLVDGHAFYERQESGIGNYFSIRSLLKSTPYNSMQVFIARNGPRPAGYKRQFNYECFGDTSQHSTFICGTAFC